MSNYQNGNLGHLYYKKYFNEFEYDFVHGIIDKTKSNDVTDRNNILYNHALQKEENIDCENSNAKFQLFTTYPGLLYGSGYQHSVGAEGEFKIGFYLDFTYGMPVLNGSSVKGVLRSVFPQAKNKSVTNKEEKSTYVKSLLKIIGLAIPDIKHIDLLEQEIFDGKTVLGEFINVYKRDIFYDAIIVNGNYEERFLGNDFITPHKHKTNSALNPFTDPTPLQFLKVLPNVEFEFRFKLYDSCVFKGLTGERKKELFKLILLDIGIGAKTNVGYGQFSETPIPSAQTNVQKQEKSNFRSRQGRQQQANQNEIAEKNRLENIEIAKAQRVKQKLVLFVQEDENWPAISTELKGKCIDATVVQISSGSLTVRPHVKGYHRNLRVSGKANISKVVKIRIQNITGKADALALEIDTKKIY